MDWYQQIVQFVQEQVSNNELFKGGLILGIGAALLSYARSWPLKVWGWIVYHTTVELDIPEGSEAFKCMDKWLAQHHYSEKRARRLTAHAKRNDDNTLIVTDVTPAPGRHFLFENRRLIILHRNRESLETAQHNGKAYTESFTMQVIGRSREPALKILDKAYALAETNSGKVIINYCDDYGCWCELCRKNPRAMDSVVLDAGKAESIIDDAKVFFERQAFYRRLGVPWRRGYLFFGAPGNGKTSTIFAIASELNMEISYLNLKELSDTSLVRAISNVPNNSILVIEDIDCIFDNDDARETKAGVSFAGLINAIDGVASPDGQLLIMTTNHRDKLDPALIRPGRVDVETEFTNATTAQACKLFRLFYSDGDVAAFQKAYDALPHQVSMAKLQSHFLINHGSAEAVSNIGMLHEPT